MSIRQGVRYIRGYDNSILRQRDVHPGSRGGEPGTHNVGSAEDEPNCSFVHLYSW